VKSVKAVVCSDLWCIKFLLTAFPALQTLGLVSKDIFGNCQSSIFTGVIVFLMRSQQCQDTDGTIVLISSCRFILLLTLKYLEQKSIF